MGRRLVTLSIVSLSVVPACAGGSGTSVNNVASEQSPGSRVGDSAPSTSPDAGGTASTEAGTDVDGVDDAEPTVPEQSAPADPTVGAPGVGDSLYPKMGNGGYDVTRYTIAVDVDVEANEIDAVTVVDATATQELARFDLDLHGLDVAQVEVDGEAAAFRRTGDELVITPAETIAVDSVFAVAVSYSGSPEPVDDPAVPFATLGWQNRDGVVYVASEPSGAPSWFPSNNHPSDKATFEFVITHDADLTAIANGVLTGTESDGDTTTTTWTMDDPMTTYLAAVAVGDFELRESTTDDGLRIRNYFPPALADDLAADFELTADVIDFYEDLFGAEYPFDEYGSLVLPFDIGYALENQTISLHGLDATDPYTIAHEILHQWAGNSVTVADWQDIWMLEGFATYLAYMYFEDRGLPSQIDPRGMYAALEGADSVGPVEVPLDELFGQSVYLRGGLALHALRTAVGDDTFRRILATYYERNAGESVSTEEFESIIDEIAGEDAVAVLDSWLYGTTLPPFP